MATESEVESVGNLKFPKIPVLYRPHGNGHKWTRSQFRSLTELGGWIFIEPGDELREKNLIQLVIFPGDITIRTSGEITKIGAIPEGMAALIRFTGLDPIEKSYLMQFMQQGPEVTNAADGESNSRKLKLLAAWAV